MWFKFSDENIYFYMAKLILEGFVPYKDFFFASPPLQIYIISFFMFLFGNKLILLKLIPIIATIISSYFIFGIVKKKFSEKEGLIASVLYLFSFLVLTTTDHSTGVHLSAMFITGLVYFIYYDQPFVAGLFASLALLTRLYAPFPIIGAGLYLLIFERKKLWKLTLGCVSLFLFVGIIMQIISHGKFLEDIFLFRMRLVDLVGIPKSDILTFFIKWDWLIVIGSLFFYFTKKKKEFFLPLLVSLFLVIFYITYSDLYYLYLGLIIPFLCVFATHFFMHFKKIKYFNCLITILLLFIIIFNSFYYIKDHSETAKINFIDEITEFVVENSNENDTLYGSFEIAPLVALTSGRKITNNFVDTNAKNFMTGTISVKERTEKMKDNIKFIFTKVLIADGNILGFESFVDYDFLKTCEIARVFPIEKDYSSNAVIVWDCKPN
jgi:4-amino-4-deoxy-L-arabinose transferase-like glycosyltransferase